MFLKSASTFIWGKIQPQLLISTRVGVFFVLFSSEGSFQLFPQRVQVRQVRCDLLPGQREPPVLPETPQVLPPTTPDTGRSAGRLGWDPCMAFRFNHTVVIYLIILVVANLLSFLLQALLHR